MALRICSDSSRSTLKPVCHGSWKPSVEDAAPDEPAALLAELLEAKVLELSEACEARDAELPDAVTDEPAAAHEPLALSTEPDELELLGGDPDTAHQKEVTQLLLTCAINRVKVCRIVPRVASIVVLQ